MFVSELLGVLAGRCLDFKNVFDNARALSSECPQIVSPPGCPTLVAFDALKGCPVFTRLTIKNNAYFFVHILIHI